MAEKIWTRLQKVPPSVLLFRCLRDFIFCPLRSFSFSSFANSRRWSRHVRRYFSLSVLDRLARRCSVDFKRCTGVSCARRRRFTACQYRNHERVFAQHYSRPHFHFALGLSYGGCGRGPCHVFVEQRSVPILFHAIVAQRKTTYVCVHPRRLVWTEKLCAESLAWAFPLPFKSFECNGHDRAEQFHRGLRRKTLWPPWELHKKST